MLPGFAGRDFFKKKKQPIPVDLRGKDWAGQVAKACGATYMFHTGGTSLNIRSDLHLLPLPLSFLSRSSAKQMVNRVDDLGEGPALSHGVLINAAGVPIC